MGGLRELLREPEKGVLWAARPRTPFQVEYPPGNFWCGHYWTDGGRKQRWNWNSACASLFDFLLQITKHLVTLLVYIIKLDILYKTYKLKFRIWGDRGQKFISTK